MARREVLVQLDDELVARLDDLARRAEVSRSELLRRASLALLEADELAQADRRLVEGYTRYPPDPVLLRVSEQLAAETIPEW